MILNTSVLSEEISFPRINYLIDFTLKDNREFSCYICLEFNAKQGRDNRFYVNDLIELDTEGFPVDHSLSELELNAVERYLKDKYARVMENRLFTQKK